jgi:hypothetical protein
MSLENRAVPAGLVATKMDPPILYEPNPTEPGIVRVSSFVSLTGQVAEYSATTTSGSANDHLVKGDQATILEA